MFPALTAIISLINVLVPFRAPADAGSVPAPGAGTVVSPVTTLTNIVGVVVGAVLTKYGVDAANSAAISGGAVAVVAAILNQLHLTGGANINTLASANPTQPAKDSTP